MLYSHNSPAAMLSAGTPDILKVSQAFHVPAHRGNAVDRDFQTSFSWCGYPRWHETAQPEQGFRVTHRLSLIATVLLLVSPTCVEAQQDISSAGRGSAPAAVRARWNSSFELNTDRI